MGSKLVKTLLLLALLLYFLLLVIARVPATWGAWAVQQGVPNVWLTGVSGTLWNGRASGGTVMVGDQALPVENLRWQLQPLKLLGLRLCAEVDAEVLAQPASGVFCQTLGGLRSAEDVHLSAPMAIIRQWLDVDLAGLVSIQLQKLRVDDTRVEALQGNLSWRDARWYNGERWVPLGAFAAKLAANEQGGVQAQIFDLDGPFTVNLTANFALHQEPAVSGTIAASAEAPEAISEALQLVGVPMDDGSFRVAWPLGT